LRELRTLPATDARTAELEEEIRKLRKINRVLMHRVERDQDAHGGDAYSLFRTAITLEAKVGERTAELTKLTHQMMHEISQRRQAEKALLAAKAEAEQANIGKTRFLAAASHDLHQPLNAARLFLGALADEISCGRARELLDRVDAALDTFDDLLGVLLDISKLDAGAWPVNLSGVAVAPLLARLIDEYRPQAGAVGLELRLVPCSAVIHTDRQLFERVLRNLLSNAIRYTASGRILVGCRRRAGYLRVEVLDTGIGIPDERREQIFEEFHRLGNAPRNDGKGLGLGLAIVDRIARLLNIAVAVQSSVGRGSCFAVTVPYGELPATVVAPDAAVEFGQPDAVAGKCVLVIENDPDGMEGMQALLAAWDCTLLQAASVDHAVAALDGNASPPDIVIADYHLDGGALGTDAIAALRARCGRALPALVISSDRSAELRRKLKALGYPFLPKPTSPARLRAMMSYLMRQRPPA
jgi:two-component system, sensor histidine kinase